MDGKLGSPHLLHYKAGSKLGFLDLELSYSKEMGGTGAATNPEQLFAAGYSACFSNAILHVAREGKVSLKSAPVS